MIRWLIVALALTALMGCSGFRGASASGQSGFKPVSSTSEVRPMPVPLEPTSYMWADPL